LQADGGVLGVLERRAFAGGVEHQPVGVLFG